MKIRIIYDNERTEDISCSGYSLEDGILSFYDAKGITTKIINANAWLTMEIIKELN